MKKIGFLSFGHWTPSPGSATRSAADALQQSIEERKANNEDAKVIEDARQFDENLRYEYWKEDKANEIEEAKLSTDIALKMVEPNEPKESGSRTAAG